MTGNRWALPMITNPEWALWDAATSVDDLAQLTALWLEGAQPGSALTPGYDGALWTQRAAVEGWIDTHRVDQLAGLAQDAGLIVITHPVRPHWWSHRERGWVDVTRRAGRTCTGFGRQRTRADLRFQYAECGPAAINAVLGSVQLTLAAPGYGPDKQVWRVLAQWTADRSNRAESSA